MAASTAASILDYLRVLVWPVAVVSLAGYFLLRYRDNVASLIDRVSEIRGPGGTAAMISPPTSQTEVFPDESPLGTDEFAETLIAQYEEVLQQVGETNEELQARVEELGRELVTERIKFEFEWIWARIFGTQIRALRALREAGEDGLPRGAVEPFFQEFRMLAPTVPWAFDDWVKFLLSPVGVVGGGESLAVDLDGNYRATEKGKAFASYIDSLGYPVRSY